MLITRESICVTKQLDPPYWPKAWNNLSFPQELSQLAASCIVAMPRGYLNIILKVKVDENRMGSNFLGLQGKKMAERKTKEWKEIISKLVKNNPEKNHQHNGEGK
jgi:hypothetical protein